MVLQVDELPARLAVAARRMGLDAAVYEATVIEQLAGALVRYLAPPPRRRWLPWAREEEGQRVAPLLLAGPVGTGKTTLMMILDRALPEQSCAPLFQQEIAAHPTAVDAGGQREQIELHPLALMGEARNIPTGVLRLQELQRFYRRFTYDRARARTDPEAAERFAALFRGRIVYVDEFVPDVVSSFPMLVINHLADHGVQVVLSSNRRDTPFVEGVQVISVAGADMRHGDLTRVTVPAGPHPLFDEWQEQGEEREVVRGVRGRVRVVDGEQWLYLNWGNLARAAADWLTFKQMLLGVDRLFVDDVPVFDGRQEVGPDAARRWVLLVDAVHEERCPLLVRLTNPNPLPPDFEAEELRAHYLPEIIVDLERAISRLRQLAQLAP